MIEEVREERAISKRKHKATSKRQRTNTTEKLRELIEQMTPEERAAFIGRNR